MISLMYHSGILEDAFEYVLGMDKDDPDAPKYEEKLKIVWKFTFKIVKWAQGGIFSYPNLKGLLIESIDIAKSTLKDKKQEIEKKWKGEQESKRKEEEDRKKNLEEEKKKEEAKEGGAKASKNAKSSASMKVASTFRGNRGKRINRRKLVNQVDVSKSKKSKKKDEAKEEKKHPDDKEEDSKQGETPASNEDKPPEVTDEELVALSSQIYTDIYSNIIIKLQDEQLLKSLCQRFAIKLDEMNIKPALKQICRIMIKEMLKPVIDFKKPTELRDNDFDIKKLEPPEVSVMNEVSEKVMFLLELNPSIDLNSQILESKGDDQTITRLKSSQEMNLLHSGDNYSGFGNKSDSDLSLQRSKSAVVNPSGKNEFLKMKSKKHSRRGIIQKGNASSKPLELSGGAIGGSSFKSVVSFITDPNIKDFKSIRESIDAHYATADNRLLGFDYLNKLLSSIRMTGQSKSIIAPLAGSI